MTEVLVFFALPHLVGLRQLGNRLVETLNAHAKHSFHFKLRFGNLYIKLVKVLTRELKATGVILGVTQQSPWQMPPMPN